jgi:hypothetical protein
VATRIYHHARALGRARGAALLYISATPTENTIDFYRGCGAVVNPAPDAVLYAQEPDDIHMLCAV